MENGGADTESGKLKALTPQDIEYISKHEGRTFKFDLSQINETTFDSLLLFLKEEFAFGFEGLGFNNDFLVETIRRIEREQIVNPFADIISSIPYKLDHSVAKTRKEFLSQLIENLALLMEESKTLYSIKFRFLPIQQQDMGILANACFNCSALRVFRLCDIPLGDKQFAKFCRALSKSSIEDIQFRKCCLTDACAGDLSALLSFHAFSKSGLTWRNKAAIKKQRSEDVHYLRNIDLRENNFTEGFVHSILNQLFDLSPDSIDLRGNTSITNTLFIRRIQKQLKSTELIIGTTLQPKAKLFPTTTIESLTEASLSQSISLQSFDKSTMRENRRIMELEDENYRLAELIDELRKKENIAMLEPDLMIVGSQANDLVKRITKLDSLFCKTKNGPKPFLRASRRIKSANFPNDSPKLKTKKTLTPKKTKK